MKEIVAKTGTYTKDNEEKAEWTRLGVIGQSDHGEYVLLDPGVNLAVILMKQRIMNPEKASKSVMASVFDNSNQQQSAPQQQAPQNNGRFDEGSIPF